jgi:hypothetical protein
LKALNEVFEAFNVTFRALNEPFKPSKTPLKASGNRGQRLRRRHLIGFYHNRQPNPYSGREGDATFPDYILLTSLSQRF